MQIRSLELSLSPASLLVGQQGNLIVRLDGVTQNALLCVSDGVDRVFLPLGQSAANLSQCQSTGDRPAGHHSLFETGEFSVPIVFTKPAVYMVNVTVVDPEAVEKVVRSWTSVSVTSAACSPPKVVLTVPGLNGLNSPELPVVFSRRQMIQITAKVDMMTCSPDQAVSQEWTIDAMDEATLGPLSLADHAAMEAAINQLAKQGFNHLTLMPGTLKPGLYLVKLAVNLKSASNTTDQDRPFMTGSGSLYLRVTPSPLVIRFREDGVSKVAWSSTEAQACLTPDLYSYDPDLPDRTADQVPLF
ncbi:unnamed protein product [Protopolystoma xenopodis]|uniref:REJ domain-containing protein n=1 Tax=Protopolystoma xenopodis TaxID=117903 RepID=A0A3S5BVP7_9PLAT|nr:unnamed protein product [Protopolystoma xenopodis]